MLGIHRQGQQERRESALCAAAAVAAAAAAAAAKDYLPHCYLVDSLSSSHLFLIMYISDLFSFSLSHLL